MLKTGVETSLSYMQLGDVLFRDCPSKKDISFNTVLPFLVVQHLGDWFLHFSFVVQHRFSLLFIPVNFVSVGFFFNFFTELCLDVCVFRTF